MEAGGLSMGDLNVALELPSNEAVLAAVEAGAGTAAISELVADAGLRSQRLVPLGFALPSRSFVVLRHKERYLSEAEKAFLQLVGDAGTQRRGP